MIEEKTSPAETSVETKEIEGIKDLDEKKLKKTDDPADFVKENYLDEAIQTHVDLMRTGKTANDRSRSADKLLEIAKVTGRGAEEKGGVGMTIQFSLDDVTKLATGLKKVKEALTDGDSKEGTERYVGGEGESGGKE